MNISLEPRWKHEWTKIQRRRCFAVPTTQLNANLQIFHRQLVSLWFLRAFWLIYIWHISIAWRFSCMHVQLNNLSKVHEMRAEMQEISWTQTETIDHLWNSHWTWSNESIKMINNTQISFYLNFRVYESIRNTFIFFLNHSFCRWRITQAWIACIQWRVYLLSCSSVIISEY